MALRDLVKTCDFCSDACTQKNLRDQIIEGIIDGDTVEALLQEPDLTLTKAISKCQAQEAAKKQCVDISHHHLESAAALRYNRGKSNAQTTTCPGCGAKPYPAGRSKCPALDQTCFHCSKVGHFAKVCRSRQLDTPPNQQNSKPATLSNMCYVASTHPAPTIPIQIVSPNGSTTTPVLPDSGADISAAGVEILHHLHEHIDNILPSKIIPKAANGARMHPVGKSQSPFDFAPESILRTYTSIPTFTELFCHGKPARHLALSYPLPLPTTPPNGTTNTASSPCLHSLETEHPTLTKYQMTKEFPTAFDGTIRTMVGEEFHIYLTENPEPFCVNTPRSIPFAYREKLKAELYLLQEQKIIAPITGVPL